MSDVSALITTARRLGHEATVDTYGAGTKHRAACSCGYSSTRRRTPALAVDALLHHLRAAVSSVRRNGT